MANGITVRLYVCAESSFAAPKRWQKGEGRRYIRQLQALGSCCDAPVLLREDITGRLFCGGCSLWWSVSHTKGRMVAALCDLPVGVDVQAKVSRPAALRWLSRVVGSNEVVTISHWTVAEAFWKAHGTAFRMPEKAEFSLPIIVESGWSAHYFSGDNMMPYYFSDDGNTCIAVVVGAVKIPQPADASCC